jgi:tRNA threonylcarbamoyladenosine biosynthesis protein TsaE
MIIEVHGAADMKAFGAQIGARLQGGEVIELVGDVGAGKTTLTKGIATGMDIDEDVQSPSFTISRVYDSSRHLQLAHYDFYRLNDAGIMADELRETVDGAQTVTIIEWAEIISGILPTDRLTITIVAVAEDENNRRVELISGGEKSDTLLGGLR